MKSRIARLLLIAMLASSVSSALACGDAGTPSETTAGGDVTSDSVEVTTAAPEYVAPDVDYKDEDFTVYVCHPKNNYVLNGYDSIFSEGENGDLINDAIYKRNRAVEEALKIKVAVHAEDKTQTFTNSIMAGDDAYDAALINMSSMKALMGDEGVLADMRTIDTLDLEASYFNQNANDEYLIGGKQYAALGNMCMFSSVALGALYFNLETAEKYKLENPYELVYEGKWTIDKLSELCKNVSSDLNGDGVLDNNDSFGISGSPTVLQQFITSCGLRVTEKNSKGVSELVLNNERTNIIIDKAVALLCDKSVNALPGDFQKYGTGDVWVNVLMPMFKNNQLLFNFNWLFYSFDLRDMETDFGLLPMPKYDEAQEEYHSQLSSYWADLLVVPATVSDTDKVGNVLNAMNFYSQQYVYPEVINRSVTDKAMRDDDSANMVDIICKGITLDLYDIYQWGTIINAATGCINAGANNFSSQYASMAPAAEAAIKTTFDTLLGK